MHDFWIKLRSYGIGDEMKCTCDWENEKEFDKDSHCPVHGSVDVREYIWILLIVLSILGLFFLGYATLF